MKVKDLFDLCIFCPDEQYEVFFCDFFYPKEGFASYVGSICGDHLDILSDRIIRFIGTDNGNCSLYLLN